jgi:hypothetical protein
MNLSNTISANQLFRSLAAIFLFAVTLSQPASAAIVINGDFATPGIAPETFANWETDFGTGFAAPIDGGGMARFSVNGFADASRQLSQTFTLPSGAKSLEFIYDFSTFAGGTSTGLSFDSFQATLFNSTGVAQSPISAGILDAFFSRDASGFQDNSSAVTLTTLGGGKSRVLLDVASLAPGQYTIDFILAGDDDGFVTTVNVDDVIALQNTSAVPEPGTALLLASIITGFAARSRIGRRQGRLSIRQ